MLLGDGYVYLCLRQWKNIFIPLSLCTLYTTNEKCKTSKKKALPEYNQDTQRYSNKMLLNERAEKRVSRYKIIRAVTSVLWQVYR